MTITMAPVSQYAAPALTIRLTFWHRVLGLRIRPDPVLWLLFRRNLLLVMGRPILFGRRIDFRGTVLVVVSVPSSTITKTAFTGGRLHALRHHTPPLTSDDPQRNP